MKSIGEIIKSARVEKKLTVADLERKTKIRSSFITAIENDDWDVLPVFPTVLGFVKSLAGALSLDENMAGAILKRDYPPKKLKITPAPDVANKVLWSPKLTFAIGVAGALIILFGYLTIQYIHFISPPKLSIESPVENQAVTGRFLNVFGFTDSDAKIIVNNQPVEVSDDGKFNVNLEVVPETHEVTVQASSRNGKITTVSRTINVEQ